MRLKRRVEAMYGGEVERWEAAWESFWDEAWRHLRTGVVELIAEVYELPPDELERMEAAAGAYEEALGGEDGPYAAWSLELTERLPTEGEGPELRKWPGRLPDPPDEPPGLWTDLEKSTSDGTEPERYAAAWILLHLAWARAIRSLRGAVVR